MMNDWNITQPDQMWCYLWEDLTDRDSGLAECKFGERFVRAGQNPEEQCHKRIRESLGVIMSVIVVIAWPFWFVYHLYQIVVDTLKQ